MDRTEYSDDLHLPCPAFLCLAHIIGNDSLRAFLRRTIYYTSAGEGARQDWIAYLAFNSMRQGQVKVSINWATGGHCCQLPRNADIDCPDNVMVDEYRHIFIINPFDLMTN